MKKLHKFTYTGRNATKELRYAYVNYQLSRQHKYTAELQSFLIGQSL